MSGDEPPLLPTVFLSYASADRGAARMLRDCLAAAGLEVWLDEEELAGGEAWDAKIRNQIRTCTYFMPIISATTETRREGYFRREWRFAVERTLDLADDVMFLLPVVIDDTRDAGARVPEKFFTVQWLRVPGGQPTPALRELAARLAAGDSAAIPNAPLAAPAESSRKSRRHAEPPPFPKFPAYPEHGKPGRFAYELVLWFGHLLHSLWCHLPRWIRVIAAAVIVFNLIGWIFRDRGRAFDWNDDRPKPEIPAEVQQALTTASQQAGGEGNPAAAVIKSIVGTTVEAIQSGKPVTVIPFSADADAGKTLADQVFKAVCETLHKDGAPLWGLSPLPLPAGAPDTEVIHRGQRMKSRFALTGHAGVVAPGLPPALVVRLFEVERNELVWKESFALTDDPATVARRIAEEVTRRLAPVEPKPAGG